METLVTLKFLSQTKNLKIIKFMTLVHNVAHTYHPDITEPIVPTNYAPQYTEDRSYSSQFSLHQIYMTDSSIISTRPNSLSKFSS